MSPPSATPVTNGIKASYADVEVHGVANTTTFTIPDALTVSGITARRSKCPPFKGGVAASTSSELFKAKAPWKPLAKRWDHRLSPESKRRKPSPLKTAARYLATPGMISLGGGLPSSDYFPFHQIDVKVPALGKFSERETETSGATISIGKHDVQVGKSAYDLTIALNYGQGTGPAQLLRWVTEHTEIVHNPPYQDWECIISVGNTSALEQLFRMFLSSGDYLIAEEFAFSSAIETALPLDVKVVGIRMDAEGLMPSHMDEVLSSWDEQARGSRKPFLLYTVPSGQNPTGATMGTWRRKELYAICQKHDVIILEDEPYYFLQMPPYLGLGKESAPLPASHAELFRSLVPSLLSLDVDGRVVRLDSFSKVLAPGSRIGWTVSSSQIAERMVRHNEVSVQNPSGFSSVILHKLLDEHWGHSGYLDWLINLRKEYTQRRDVFLDACEKYLPKTVVSWVPPTAGMFLWMKIDHEMHPEAGKRSIASLEDELFQAAIQNKVLVSPGSWFAAERGPELREMFFRATYAAAEPHAMIEAIKRFGDTCRKVFNVED